MFGLRKHSERTSREASGTRPGCEALEERRLFAHVFYGTGGDDSIVLSPNNCSSYPNSVEVIINGVAQQAQGTYLTCFGGDAGFEIYAGNGRDLVYA